MKRLPLPISLITLSVVTTLILNVIGTYAQDAKPNPITSDKPKVISPIEAPIGTTISIKDFSQQDQAKIQELSKSVADIQKDIELAQTKIALAQAQLTRVNEVQLPQLEQALRDAYKLPKDQWDWNIQTLTFTKRK